MRIVGAENWFIRGPYLLQSTLYSILAVGVACAVLIPLMLSQYTPLIESLFGETNFSKIPYSIIGYGVGVELTFALLLSLFSSYYATRKYIKY